jgi:hypothetical protein
VAEYIVARLLVDDTPERDAYRADGGASQLQVALGSEVATAFAGLLPAINEA